MKFWRIYHPEYDSDYRYTYINGSLEHPFSLPGVRCDVCGNTWGGRRILPNECPKSFRSKLSSRWPISRQDHEILQKELMAALAVKGNPFMDLCPGDFLQPCFLDVPSHPRADFLWSSLGSLVVSQRIKDAFVESCSPEIVTRPVTMRKIGSREARLPPPMPSTGEPEDMIDEVPILEDKSKIGSYFEILILNESNPPFGVAPALFCSGCNRPLASTKDREFRMAPEIWKGHSIFFFATTLWIVITDQMKDLLVRLHPTNVQFQSI